MRLAASFVAALAALAMPACIAVSKTEPVNADAPAHAAAADKPKDANAPKDDPAQKRRAAETRVAIAEQRMHVAQLDMDGFKINSAKGIENASKELEMAQSKLDQYMNLDAPNRQAQAELSLAGARDRAQEAVDELAQIELMYKEQDLNDKTAEFVVSRGRRNAERAKQSIAIQEKELEALVKHTMPRDLASMKLDLSRKSDEVDKAKRGAESGAIEKQIAMMNAQKELDDAKTELGKLPAGGTQ